MGSGCSVAGADYPEVVHIVHDQLMGGNPQFKRVCTGGEIGKLEIAEQTVKNLDIVDVVESRIVFGSFKLGKRHAEVPARRCAQKLDFAQATVLGVFKWERSVGWGQSRRNAVIV